MRPVNSGVRSSAIWPPVSTFGPTSPAELAGHLVNGLQAFADAGCIKTLLAAQHQVNQVLGGGAHQVSGRADCSLALEPLEPRAMGALTSEPGMALLVKA